MNTLSSIWRMDCVSSWYIFSVDKWRIRFEFMPRIFFSYIVLWANKLAITIMIWIHVFAKAVTINAYVEMCYWIKWVTTEQQLNNMLIANVGKMFYFVIFSPQTSWFNLYLSFHAFIEIWNSQFIIQSN